MNAFMAYAFNTYDCTLSKHVIYLMKMDIRVLGILNETKQLDAF